MRFHVAFSSIEFLSLRFQHIWTHLTWDLSSPVSLAKQFHFVAKSNTAYMKQDLLNPRFWNNFNFRQFFQLPIVKLHSAKAHWNGSTVGNLSGRLQQCNASLAKWSQKSSQFITIFECHVLSYWFDASPSVWPWDSSSFLICINEGQTLCQLNPVDLFISLQP